MTRLITRSQQGTVAPLSWRWECPQHEWVGLWERYRETAWAGGMDHDVHYHGRDPDADYDDN